MFANKSYINITCVYEAEIILLLQSLVSLEENYYNASAPT